MTAVNEKERISRVSQLLVTTFLVLSAVACAPSAQQHRRAHFKYGGFNQETDCNGRCLEENFKAAKGKLSSVPGAGSEAVGSGANCYKRRYNKGSPTSPEWQDEYDGNFCDWTWIVPEQEIEGVLTELCQEAEEADTRLSTSYEREGTKLFLDGFKDGRTVGYTIDGETSRRATVNICSVPQDKEIAGETGEDRFVMHLEGAAGSVLEAYRLKDGSLVPIAYYRAEFWKPLTVDRKTCEDYWQSDPGELASSSTDPCPAVEANKVEVEVIDAMTKVRHEYYDGGRWVPPGEDGPKITTQCLGGHCVWGRVTVGRTDPYVSRASKDPAEKDEDPAAVDDEASDGSNEASDETAGDETDEGEGDEGTPEL